MNNLALLLLALGGIILTVGDIVMKEWVINNKILFYFIGLFIYLIGLNFFSS